MKRGALALSVVLLTAGCSAYDGAVAPSASGDRAVTGAPDTTGRAVHLSASKARQKPTLTGTQVKFPAAVILHAWDRERAHAWATGDTAALAHLYVPGSQAGRADVAELRSYLRRGLRVVGLRMQVFTVLVLAHRRHRWRLRVTDRLARAVAVGRSGGVRLPRDLASTRIITLVRGGDGQWRVASVQPLGRQ